MRDLIERRFGIRLSLQGVGGYLRRCAAGSASRRSSSATSTNEHVHYAAAV